MVLSECCLLPQPHDPRQPFCLCDPEASRGFLHKVPRWPWETSPGDHVSHRPAFLRQARGLTPAGRSRPGPQCPLLFFSLESLSKGSFGPLPSCARMSWVGGSPLQPEAPHPPPRQRFWDARTPRTGAQDTSSPSRGTSLWTKMLFMALWAEASRCF